MNTSICVLTYNHPHRKTQDVLFRLKALGYKDVYVIAQPWEDRKNYNSLFINRPSPLFQMSVKEMCLNLSYSCHILGQDLTLKNLSGFGESHLSPIIIAGSGKITQDIVQSKPYILNSHPGWLPDVRGLDALKWAIYDNHPIGITTYYIGNKVDTGSMIQRKATPITLTDTFFSLSYRHYDLELQLLTESIGQEPSGDALGEWYEADGMMTPSQVHRRMKPAKEMLLEDKLRHRILHLLDWELA